MRGSTCGGGCGGGPVALEAVVEAVMEAVVAVFGAATRKDGEPVEGFPALGRLMYRVMFPRFSRRLLTACLSLPSVAAATATLCFTLNDLLKCCLCRPVYMQTIKTLK